MRREQSRVRWYRFDDARVGLLREHGQPEQHILSASDKPPPWVLCSPFFFIMNLVFLLYVGFFALIFFNLSMTFTAIHLQNPFQVE